MFAEPKWLVPMHFETGLMPHATICIIGTIDTLGTGYVPGANYPEPITTSICRKSSRLASAFNIYLSTTTSPACYFNYIGLLAMASLLPKKSLK